MFLLLPVTFHNSLVLSFASLLMLLFFFSFFLNNYRAELTHKGVGSSALETRHTNTTKTWVAYGSSHLFSSVQFSSVQDGIYALGKKKKKNALHPVSQKFPQRCLWNGSNVRLTDDGPLSSFDERSSSASSFNASLLSHWHACKYKVHELHQR